MEEDSVSSSKTQSLFQRMGSRVFYGWWIVVLGSLINGIGLGIIYHSVTIFFLPLKRDLGVSSAAISLLYGAARLEGGFDGPVVGYLVHRFGSRRLIMIGAILAGIGFIILSTVHDFITFLLIYVLLISFGNNAGFFHPVTTAVNKWFIRKRGISFSIVSASGNIGGMVMAPVLSYIILNFGWRYGAVFAGSMIMLVALPSAWRFKNSPEEMGLLPDGKPPLDIPAGESFAANQEAAEVNFTVKEALRSLQFWLLMTSISLRLVVTIAMNIHFVPILVWRGMNEATSAYLVSLMALSCIFSTLAFGWLGDRWNKSLLCSLGIIPAIIAMMGLILSQAPVVLYLFPIGFALTMGTAPLNWALIGDLFGRGSYATVRGIMAVGYGTATFFSPIFAGWVFDHTGSYTVVLITFTIIFMITATFFAMLRHPSRAPLRT
jgi:sugar phosphate permease